MIITQAVFDSIMRKNGRARKKMARRMMRKAFANNCRELGISAAQIKQYTTLEMELANHVSRGWSAKTKRKQAKRVQDIEKSVRSEMRTRAPLELRHLY